jgi:hypothetical protein
VDPFRQGETAKLSNWGKRIPQNEAGGKCRVEWNVHFRARRRSWRGDNVAEFEEGKLRKPSEDLETATRKAEALKDKAGVCRGAACGRVSVVRRRGHFTDDLIVHQKRVSPRPTPWRNSSDDMDLLHKYLAAASL